MAGANKVKVAFEKLPPSHRREYISWIEEAKRPETRARRIQQTLARLVDEEGQGPYSSRSLMEKLGVKPGYKVLVLGFQNEDFGMQLGGQGAYVKAERPEKDSDLVFLLAESQDDLEKVQQLKSYIKKDGAVWVVYPKGQPHIKEMDVIAAGRAAGLTDTKVVSFSATHTALKFVIPRASR